MLVEADCPEKREALKAQNFEKKKTLKKQVKAKTVKVILMQLEESRASIHHVQSVIQM
jgi:hypothetical protein